MSTTRTNLSHTVVTAQRMSIISHKVTEMAKSIQEGTANYLLNIAWKAGVCGILKSCFPKEKAKWLLHNTPDTEIWDMNKSLLKRENSNVSQMEESKYNEAVKKSNSSQLRANLFFLLAHQNRIYISFPTVERGRNSIHLAWFHLFLVYIKKSNLSHVGYMWMNYDRI